jgi:hypothetical protein
VVASRKGVPRLTGEDALDEEEAVDEKEGDLVKEEEG